MEPGHYSELKSVLREARNAGVQHRIYYDLTPGESKPRIKKDLAYVADQEGINVKIRSLRGTDTLEFLFDQPVSKTSSQPRFDAAGYRQTVLDILGSAEKPLKKGEILSRADLSGSTWNLRIKELIESGEVVREGERRDATYSLA